MKCRKCGYDIPNRIILSEAARIMGKKSKRKLSSKEARNMAIRSHEARRIRIHTNSMGINLLNKK